MAAEHVGVRYMPQLDGLRFFAVGGVIFEHWASGFPGLLRDVVERLDLGGLGVECFFVLSGFLITLILLGLKDGHSSFRTALGHFYMRRVLRIFPAYYLALLVTALLLPEMRGVLGWNAAYLSNLYPVWHGTWPPAGGHFWSLSVEEQFYLFWPLLVLVSPKATVKRLAIGLVLVAPASRWIVWTLAGGSHIANWTVATSALDLLCVGALLACLTYQAPKEFEERLVRVLALVGAVAFVLYAALYMFWRDTPYYIVLARLLTGVFFGALVLSAARGNDGVAGRVLGSKAVVWVGLISYGLYIWHPFIPKAYVLVVHWLGLDAERFGTWYVRFPLLALLLLVVTAASYYLMERPVRGLRRHFA